MAKFGKSHVDSYYWKENLLCLVAVLQTQKAASGRFNDGLRALAGSKLTEDAANDCRFVGNVRAFSLERFPIRWNHLIDQNSLKTRNLDPVMFLRIQDGV